MNNTKLNYFLLFIILVQIPQIVYSAEYEMCMNEDNFRVNYIAKFDITPYINPTSGSTTNNRVCEGDDIDIDELIQKEILASSMYVSTLCNNLPGMDYCSGYTPYNSNNNDFQIHIMDNEDFTDFINNNSIKTYGDYNFFTKYYDISKILKNTGRSNLFKEVGQTPINAEGKYGVACIGDYNYQIKSGSSTLKTFSGNLTENVQAEYTFNKEGSYSINYKVNINNCFALYQEKYSGGYKEVHTFTDITKSNTNTGSKTLNIQVIDDDGPNFTAPSGNVNCGLIYSGGIFQIPPALVQGESVIIPTTMRISNIYDVPITVSKINANFYDVVTFPIINQQPTTDIKINSITTDPLITSGIFAIPVTLNPGQTRTIKIYINATVTTDEPDEDYNLRMGFNYNYPTPSHGCYLGDNGMGSCSGPITVDVVEIPEVPEPTKMYALNANVYVIPDNLDLDYYYDGKNTVNVLGRVNVTITTTTPGTTPIVTTETIFANGADVELKDIIFQNTGESCLVPLGTKAFTKTNSNGNYTYSNVQLKAECLKLEKTDLLIATIGVRYQIDEQTLVGTYEGDATYNTNIPSLDCEIFYDMEGTNPESEKYNITVQIYHGIDMQRIIYTCGLEDMEQADLNGADEYEFSCEYEFKDDEDTEYIVAATVYDTDERIVSNFTCTANVGLCLPYV